MVQAAILDYHRRLEADPAAALEQAAWLESAFVDARITFDGVAMRSFLRPQLVDRAQWEVLCRSGRRILELAARVARHAFDGDAGRLCDWLGTPEAEARWVRLDPGPPDVVLSRLDAFLTPRGPRFIEINSDAPAGFGYGDRMAEVFRRLPVFRAFAAATPVRYVASGPSLVDAVLRAWQARGDGRPPVVAIVDWAEVKTRADQELLAELFRLRGVPCLLADPRALELIDRRLVADGTRIDVVYRRGVLSELVQREDEVRAFLDAYRDGLALFVNSLRCRLSEDKAFFGLLTDEAYAHLLTPDERGLVASCLPWTRKLEERRTQKDGAGIDLLPYVLAHREHLVLKPAHGYGGQSVWVGCEMTPAAWESAAWEALKAPWVVQERVEIPEEAFPVCAGGSLAFESLKVNVNPFYVAGADAGAVARVSRSAVINVSAGGGSVPTFVIG